MSVKKVGISMKNISRVFSLVILSAVLVLSATSCTGTNPGMQDDGEKIPEPSNDPVIITLEETKITANDEKGLSVNDTTLTINAPGTYKISGRLSDGSIIVDTLQKGDVFLILSGVDITCLNSAPIYCKQVKNLYLVLDKDTVNTVTDGVSYVLPVGEDEPDAAIFSKDDLFIMGEGSLVVNAKYKDGITGKDDVNIESGNITVTAKDHGIKGKDSLEIKGGTVTVNATGDGLKSTEDMDATLGFVEISGGKITITAGDEGIQAQTNVVIKGGEINITSVDDAVKAEQIVSVLGGTLDITTNETPFSGMKIENDSSAKVTVNGKDFKF